MREDIPAIENNTQESFVLIKLKHETLIEYGLPDKLLPVRISVLEENDLRAKISFRVFADECRAYCEQHPEKKEECSILHTRLYYLAGIEAGRAGDDLDALGYFSVAFEADPGNLDIAANCALALLNNDMSDQALEMYEFIIETIFDNGERGFSEKIWSMAVKLNCLKGNFNRALDLLEATLPTASMDFVADAAITVKKLREATDAVNGN